MSSRVSPQAAVAILGGATIAAAFWLWRHKRNNKALTGRAASGREKRVSERASGSSGAASAVDNNMNNNNLEAVVESLLEETKQEKQLTNDEEREQGMDDRNESSNDEASHKSSDDRSVSDGDYEDEESRDVVGVEAPKEEPLSLNLLLNMAEESFSWSEEVERSYLEEREERERRAAADSPSRASQQSEVSSQDSGRATGGLASSLSPLDGDVDTMPMYEFEIPNTLVGLIIGVKGKTIKELSTRTDVRMLIREHHSPAKVRGRRENINRCLQMLRRRFPPARFPELNLQPVFPPPLPNFNLDVFNTQPSWGVMCEVVVSSTVDVGHFFVQQPTHPSFSSLQHLDVYMLRLYSQPHGIPELPKPCDTGLLCAAPVMGAWFRAVTVAYYSDDDHVLVRFVDYGGYARIPRTELRQIRTDLMSLPFQATECYLAHVQPVDGTLQWSEEAKALFQRVCTNRIVEAFVVGHHCDDKTPFVEIHTTDDKGNAARFDRLLMDASLAKASDPSKVVRAVTRPRPPNTPAASP